MDKIIIAILSLIVGILFGFGADKIASKKSEKYRNTKKKVKENIRAGIQNNVVPIVNKADQAVNDAYHSSVNKTKEAYQSSKMKIQKGVIKAKMIKDVTSQIISA